MTRVHRLDCRGCDVALPEQTGVRGSLRRYHPECQTVVRHWSRLRGVTERLERYHALKAAGAYPPVALLGCSGKARFEATLEMLQEET